MSKNVFASVMLGMALCMGHVQAQQGRADDTETEVRVAALQALWPADLVRLTTEYVQQYPRGPWADVARNWQRRAADTMRVLNRGDVHLYRSAFQGTGEEASVNDEIREAALGSQAAAVRLAYKYQKGEGGLTRDENRYVGWLQFASVLGNAAASYELALYFRKENQPALASQYEARAVSLGYNPPLALDHVRK
ncbi:MAG TPA: hypothetical protein H9903_12515 [Candidatus Aquabacterium excrementipullorum]|nr:hypothetical protein [Candidatus Aquabacterium excrementipullorum]